MQRGLALLALAACLLERGEFGGAFIKLCLQRLRFFINGIDALCTLRRQRRFLFFQLCKLFFQRALALLALAACLLERGEFGTAFIKLCLQRLRFAIRFFRELSVFRRHRRFLFLQLRQLFLQRGLALRAFIARIFQRYQFISTLIKFIAQCLHIVVKTRGVFRITLCDGGFFCFKTRNLFLQCAFARRLAVA